MWGMVGEADPDEYFRWYMICKEKVDEVAAVCLYARQRKRKAWCFLYPYFGGMGGIVLVWAACVRRHHADNLTHILQ